MRAAPRPARVPVRRWRPAADPRRRLSAPDRRTGSRHRIDHHDYAHPTSPPMTTVGHAVTRACRRAVPATARADRPHAPGTARPAGHAGPVRPRHRARAGQHHRRAGRQDRLHDLRRAGHGGAAHPAQHACSPGSASSSTASRAPARAAGRADPPVVDRDREHARRGRRSRRCRWPCWSPARPCAGRRSSPAAAWPGSLAAALVFSVLMYAVAEMLANRLPSPEAYIGAVPGRRHRPVVLRRDALPDHRAAALAHRRRQGAPAHPRAGPVPLRPHQRRRGQPCTTSGG